MNKANRCAQCQAVVSAHSPHGLCPRCLLKRGLDTQTQYSQEGSQAEATAECTPPTPEEMTGLFPDLEILKLLGRGGMGVVYLARQKRLDRLVALKILSPRFSRNAAFAERFAREARAMAMLNHPHVVAVYDFGEVDGLYYFLMEFVDGLNLRQLLDSGKLASEEALAIVPQICDALQYAHDHGVVHRDIKPENVLLDKESRVKIADFGIAKLVRGQDAGHETQAWEIQGDVLQEGSSPSHEPLTAAGQVIGTPQYMAPEQIEHPLQVDHRADIYSLGVVFYQMLTGELPTDRFAPPSQKVQIDVRLDKVVLRAMEKEPQLRYQQVSEVKTEVEGIASTNHASDESASSPSRIGQPKTSMCYVSSPEHLRSFRGRFVHIYKGKGELQLDNESLRFHSDWPMIVISLSSIRKIAQGDYPFSAKPLPIHYIEVTFEEHGLQRTLLFTPVLREVIFPQEANRYVAEWLSALQETIQAKTGRTLSMEHSQVSQDRLWFVKTFLLTIVTFTVVFSMIPLILKQRLPNRLSEWLLGPIVAAVLMVVFVAMRWLRHRSVVTSRNSDSLAPDKVDADLCRDTPMPAAATKEDKTTWRSPDSGWGWLIGKMSGITFTSRLAYRFANLSALGFLGSLGFIPAHGWGHCFGFFGFFGLIGIAHMIEVFARPNLRMAKIVTMVTAIGMAIAVFVSFFLAYFNGMPPRQQRPADRTAIADTLEEFRKTLVVYDLGPDSFNPNQEWKHYDAERLKMYPNKHTWPDVLGHVDTNPDSFKIIRTNSQSDVSSGPNAFMTSLETLIGPQGITTLLFLKGIKDNGMIVVQRCTALVCLGEMEGRLVFVSYATALIKGDMSGSIASQSYLNLVVTGKFTGQIKADSYAMIYLLGGFEGNLKLNTSKVYIAGRTTQADLSSIKGNGKVYLEASDLPPGEHKIGDLSVTVGGTPSPETPSPETPSSETPSSDIQPKGNVQPLDLLQIHVINTLLKEPIDGYYLVECDGNVSLGPSYGRVNVKGLGTKQAEQSILDQLKKTVRNPKVQVTLAKRLRQWRRAVFSKSPYTIEPNDSLSVQAQGTFLNQPIDGQFTVEPKGTVALGPAYGRVKVSGLTLEEAEKAIQKHLDKILNDPEVQVTLPHDFVNSKDIRWQKVRPPQATDKIKPGELLFLNVTNELINQPIQGIYLVEPGGTVALGPAYGRVKVQGLTPEEAEKAIHTKLCTILTDPKVSVTLAGWIDKESDFNRPVSKVDEEKKSF